MDFTRQNFYRDLIREISPGSNLTEDAIETWTALFRAHRFEWSFDLEISLERLSLPSDLERQVRLAYAEDPTREHCLNRLYREILKKDLQRLLTVGLFQRLGITPVTPDVLFRERQTLTRYRVLSQTSLEEYLDIERGRLPRVDRFILETLEAAAHFPVGAAEDQIRQVFDAVDAEALDFLSALLLVEPSHFEALSHQPHQGLTFEALRRLL